MTNDLNLEEPSASEGISPEEMEQFDALMSDYLESIPEIALGQVTTARVVSVDKDSVLLDIGDKAEGVVPAAEFTDFTGNVSVKPGDEVTVIVQSRDSNTGQVTCSYRKARLQQNWGKIEEAHREHTVVQAYVQKVAKNNSGLIVDAGINCFMPASQVEMGRTTDLGPYVGKILDAYVIDIDAAKKRAVLSRRQLLAEEQKKKRDAVLAAIEEGQTVSGKIKSVVEFGVFVDLGGVDGLVPRDEVAWGRVKSLAEEVKPGTTEKFKVLQVDKERGRITLSRRQLKADPWERIDEEYPDELTVSATVEVLTPYCAYVTLADGIEGRIHRENLSWNQSVRKPEDVLKKGDQVKAVVLGRRKEKRLLELGLKQISVDPLVSVLEKYPVNSRHKVTIAEVTNFGAFVQLDDTVRGLIHVSDINWDRNLRDPNQVLKAGDEVEVLVLKFDVEQRRINLGMKQCSEDPFETFLRAHPSGSHVTGTVKSVADFGAFIELAPKVEGLLHISQWDRGKTETLQGLIKPGDEVAAKIIKVERKERKISLSRRAHLQDEERREVEQYKSVPKDVTTSLGSLLKDLKLGQQD